MRRSIIIIIFIFAILFGQGNSSSPGRVFHKIDMASDFLEQVSSELGENPPEQATAYIEQARELIQQARREYDNGNMTTAENLAEQSLNLCQQALSVQRNESPEIRKAERELEQCRSLMEELSPRITSLGDNSLSDLFNKGSDLFKNAQSSLDKGDARLAYSLAKQANSLFHKISARLAGGVNAEKVLTIIERTDEIIEQTKDEFDNNIPVDAKTLLDAANRLQKSASEAFDRGDIRAATNMTMSARQKAQEAHKIAGGSLSPEFIKNEIEQTKSALAQIELSEEKNSEVKKLIEKAQTALKGEQYRQAANFIRNAKNILGEENLQSNQTPSPESVQKAIIITDKIISSAKADDETSRALLEQAKSNQQQAKEDFQKGKYSAALNKTRVAKEIAQQIQ